MAFANKVEFLNKQRLEKQVVHNRKFMQYALALVIIAAFMEMADHPYSNRKLTVFTALTLLFILFRERNKMNERHNRTFLSGVKIESARATALLGDFGRFNELFEGIVKEHINACDRDTKRTLLHCATLGGDPRIIDLALQENANINAQDSNGNTPVHYAILNVIAKKSNAYAALFELISFKKRTVARASSSFFVDPAAQEQLKANLLINPLLQNNNNQTIFDLIMRSDIASSAELQCAQMTIRIIRSVWEEAQRSQPPTMRI